MKQVWIEFGPHRIRVWTAGEGPVLLWLHGADSHPGDAPYLRELALTRTVVAPELPGYGESTSVDYLRDLLDVVLLVRAITDRFTTGAFDVVGHSLGAMIGAELAIVAPDRVRSLVLVSPFGLWIDAQPLPDPYAMTPKALATAVWFDGANAERETRMREGDTALDRAIERSMNSGTASRFLWPIPDRGLRRRASYLLAPTLVVRGEHDGLIPPEYADEFARIIPSARVATVANAGHLPMVESEDDFLAAVGEFLDSH